MSDQATPIRGNRAGEGWHLEPRRRWLLLVGAVLAAALLIVPGIVAATQGKLLAAAFCIVIGLAFLALPFGRTRRRLPARAWTDGTEHGVLLPTHPMKVTSIAALAVLGSVLTAAGVGIGVEAVLDGTYGDLVGAFISLLIGLLMLLGAYAGIRSRMASDRGLLLTPAAVTLRTGRVVEVLPWTGVVAVHAHWNRRVRGAFKSVDEQIDNWLTFQTAPGVVEGDDPLALMSGTKQPTLDAETLAMDPYVVVDVLRFYLEQPDRRTELATDAALARVADLERNRALTTH
ncbi:hypothetical protein H5V45_13455 [Nocardioides sp. KIGAM211]|uniref:Uncharacterized protein n=1 Tax=Nocardioides luti TaxID=2761101 RepID=A0A7X0RHE6_9ACTN|nr:hypothetical protein [Nocardioides luti]MBB6628327.1 hypothetical protein [Nocardioides luti]